MVYRIITFFIGMATLLTPLFAQSEHKAPGVLTLTECLSLAQQYNFDIRKAASQLQAAGAGITAAFGQYLPGISLSAGYSRRLDQQQQQFVNIGGQLIPVPRSPANSYSLNIGTSLPIFDGFAREARFSQAQDQFRIAELNLADTRRRVLLQVRQQFLEVLKAYRIVDARTADIEAAEAQLRQLEAQHQAGRIAKTVVYQQQADIAAKRLALVQAQNQLDIAKARLLSLIGLDPSTTVEFSAAELPDTITAAFQHQFRQHIGDPTTAFRRALQHRPDYLAAKLRIEVANATVAMARSGYFPSLSASLSWSWANSELRDFDRLGRTFVGLSLRIPVFDNFQTNERVQSAIAQRIQREVEQQQLEHQIATEIEQAWRQLDASEKELAAATIALHAAELNYRSIEHQQKLGRVAIVDRILANSRLLSAKIDYLTALFNYLGARYTLLATIGILDGRE